MELLNILVLLGAVGTACAALGGPCDPACNAISNSQCENSVTCVCKSGYVPSQDQQRCLKMATAWMGPCEEKLQCTAVFAGPVDCVAGKCNCLPGNHFEDGQCWPNRFLNDACSNSHECVLLDFPNRVECKAGRCVCRAPTYVPTEDGKSCRNSAAQLVLSLVALLPALLIIAPRKIFS